MHKTFFALIAAAFSAASLMTISPVEAAIQSSVLISEIHYHPTDGTEYEFIELYNPGSDEVSLDGFAFTEA